MAKFRKNTRAATNTNQNEYPTLAMPSEFQPPFDMSSRMRTFLRNFKKYCTNQVTMAVNDNKKPIMLKAIKPVMKTY